MKKIYTALSIFILLSAVMLSGCVDQKAAVEEPDIFQVRNICNLATLECYYHNVAKSVKTAGKGILHLGEKERTFWIEYTGVARLGIDMTKVEMEVDKENVEITLPAAEVLSVTIDPDSLTEESYIESQDGFFNKNKITAADQTEAINQAQKNMEEEVKKNSSLLLNAQNRAKTLIENYVGQLGTAVGVDYKIKWVYEKLDFQDDEESVKESEEISE